VIATMEQVKKAWQTTAMELYGDLEWALVQELEVHDEPSQHLLSSVQEWAIALYEGGNGPMTKEHYDSAIELTKQREW
tara:strand:- start:660 stop:893 length:234 start_codon:yes stop_codon:yes gene_type:complete